MLGTLRRHLKRVLGIESLQVTSRNLLDAVTTLDQQARQQSEALKAAEEKLVAEQKQTEALTALLERYSDALKAIERIGIDADQPIKRSEIDALKAAVKYTINREVSLINHGRFVYYQFSDDALVRNTIIRSAQYKNLVIDLKQARQNVDAAISTRVPSSLDANEVIQSHWSSPDAIHYNSIHRALLACIKASGRTVDFIDVGANIGDTAMFAVDVMIRLGIKGNVYSFEPGPVFELARANIWLNRLNDQIEVVHAAASDVDGYVPMRIIVGHSESGSIAGIDQHYPDLPVGETRMVRAVKIDTFFAGRAHSDLYLKIDAEGHDFQVVRGAKGLIDAGRIPIIHFELTPKYMQEGDREVLEACYQRYKLFNLRTLDVAGSFNRFDEIQPNEITDFLQRAANFHGWTDAVLISHDLAGAEAIRTLAAGRSAALQTQ